MILIAVMSLFAATDACRIQKIEWSGERPQFDESQLKMVKGMPCDHWRFAVDKLVRYYEDNGFVAAQIQGSVSDDGVLKLDLHRGDAFVWAPAENLDSSKSNGDVLRKLSGLEAGDPVSVRDLERAERKLARMGYFEETAPVRMFRDPVRNRIVPAFSLRDASFSEAEALLTYSSEDDVWEGQVNVNLFNILGTARDLQLEGFTGEDSRHLQGSYKEPWIFGTNWNVVLRGYFDEETLWTESDSVESGESEEYVERLIMGEIGVTRDIGFDFSIGVFFGLTEDDKHSTFEMSYVSLDRFVLPRKGWRVSGSMTYRMDRPDTLDNFLLAQGHVARYMPMYGNFIARFSGSAAGIFHSDAALKRSDYISLGGMDSFKGMGYHFTRTRSFGFSELAILWQDGYDLSIEAFYQPGLYRPMDPSFSWAREQDYGIAFTQYRKNWSVNLYYAMRNGCNYLDGVIGFGVKTLF